MWHVRGQGKSVQRGGFDVFGYPSRACSIVPKEVYTPDSQLKQVFGTVKLRDKHRNFKNK